MFSLFSIFSLHFALMHRKYHLNFISKSGLWLPLFILVLRLVLITGAAIVRGAIVVKSLRLDGEQ